MKHLKLFEDIYEKKIPKVGEWIFASNAHIGDEPDQLKLTDFVKSHVGKVTEITKDDDNLNHTYEVIYDISEVNEDDIDMFDDYHIEGNYCYIQLYFSEVTHWSDSEKELREFIETKLSGDKFGL